MPIVNFKVSIGHDAGTVTDGNFGKAPEIYVEVKAKIS